MNIKKIIVGEDTKINGVYFKKGQEIFVEEDKEVTVMNYVVSIYKDGMNRDDVEKAVIKKFGGDVKTFRNAITNGMSKGKSKKEEKKYNVKNNVGKAKYVVNYHDGVKTHKDGSEFYDISIFKNKTDLKNFISDLEKDGYKSEEKENIKESSYSVEELVDSYINGNISWVKKQLGRDRGIYNDMLDYMEDMGMDQEFIRRFRNRMKEETKFKEARAIVDDISYEDIVYTLENNMSDVWDDITGHYELWNDDIHEVEHNSRDGFMAFTDGGIDCTGFTDISWFWSTGYGAPSGEEDADKEIQRVIDDSYDYAEDEFKRSYPDIYRELESEGISYHSIQEAGYEREAEEYDEYLRDYMSVSVMFRLTAYIYNPDNYNNDFSKKGQYGLFIKYAVNTDYDYHREKGDMYIVSESFGFSSIKELEKNLKKVLAKVKSNI